MIITHKIPEKPKIHCGTVLDFNVSNSRAAPDSWFSHLAVEVPGEETSNEWCEQVSGEAYGQLE